VELNELIMYLQKLQSEGKGNYKMRTHDIDYNEANGGSYIVDENIELNSGNIQIDESEQSITFGDYCEYYSY